MSDGRTQIGPIARSAEDLERALSVIAGPDWRDGGVAPVPLRSSGQAKLRNARFAVITAEGSRQTAPEIADAVERAAAVLEGNGLSRTEWTSPLLADAIEITRRYWARTTLTGEEADRRLQDWDRFRRHYLEAAEHIDLVLTPATRETAPLQRDIRSADYIFLLPASLTGSPAVGVPAGQAADGLPVSVQIVGRPWEDHRVLAAASLLGTGG
jgi:Asp-tRNA(Asn)/Glu-tRNA(Gln) amidotransferase A subunit family amidase